jgi:hypothetical protein
MGEPSRFPALADGHHVPPPLGRITDGEKIR